MSPEGLIGRRAERARLQAALASCVGGRGSLLLLSGEAGAGKTRLAEEVLAHDGEARFLRGAASPSGSPFGPLTGAMREYLRLVPGGLDDCGPLRDHLALVLPELGAARESEDRATLFEALRCALVTLSREVPAAILLDDLQWSDEATLDVLGSLAPTLHDVPLLIVGAYRSDELPRDHPLRRLRHDLRRDRCLEEIALEPLSPAESAELVDQVLAAPASPQLASLLHERTGGVPFFVEEFATALQAGDRLTPGGDGLDLDLDSDVPLPQTVRDAVLVRLSSLPDPVRSAAEAAAVGGPVVDLDAVAAIAGAEAVGGLLAAGLLAETEPGRARFRNPLLREAIYADVPWLRRSELHRRFAEAMTTAGADPAQIAAHWLAARDTARARAALLEAVDGRVAVHAHGDAARLGRQALDLWPEGERGTERLETLERYARHAELAGDFAEAARAQREVADARRAEGAGRALADAERRLAGIYALQGDRPRALAARRVAAEAYAANALPGEAAAERLVAAAYLQAAARLTDAATTAREAGGEALRAERPDLRARAMALEGVALAKLGLFDDGVELLNAGLALALEHGLTLEAAEVYQRLGTAHEVTGDYARAREALGTAIGLCERPGGDGLEHTCVSCMAYVLRELGDWDQAQELCETLIVPGASADATLVADGVLGAILAWRGRLEDARPLLERCLETATRLDVTSMLCDSAAALAWLAHAEGDDDRAAQLCRVVLGRWEQSEDHHYAVWGLRWSAAFLARRGDLADARACAAGLSAIAASSGHPDAIAGLAHALGETALAEGDADAAAQQLARAVELHESLDIPFERAQILQRSGAALAAAGDPDAALQELREGHRLARMLDAAPVAASIAADVAALGVSVEEHLGRRAAAEHEHAGLSRREVEVVRLVAAGLTNREIAERLVLSTRTVDMHVRNILAKLRCRSRTEAARRAAALGLLVDEAPSSAAPDAHASAPDRGRG